MIHTDHIPVIDKNGVLLDEIKLSEKVTPSLARRGGYATSGTYYKGAGKIYMGHLSNQPSMDEKILKKMPLSYEKYTVIYEKIFRQFGIFTFPHQPVFSDYEGGCGKKEEQLVVNQMHFRRSAIEEITDIIDTGIENHKIYAYRMKKVQGEPDDIIRLLSYILEEDYNTAWDKNLWGDITSYGYVRDLADWFVSCEFCHKLGTVYALLNSLYASDNFLYEYITNKLIGLNYYNSMYILYISALVVEKFCPQVVRKKELDLTNWSLVLYAKLLNELYAGRACCHLEEEYKWDFVRTDFKKKIPEKINMMRYEIAATGVVNKLLF